MAVGDIVKNVADANRTGRLARRQKPDLVLLLGDIQYPNGTAAQFRTGFAKTVWAELLPRTKPTPGNHDYTTLRAAGYFEYFEKAKPYYAFDVDPGWRGYSLNSEIALGPQLRWLRADLAAHPGLPILAFWHRPRFSSGSEHGSSPAMQPLWDAFDGRAGVVLGGHDHHYERFAPRGGRRQFVVGTGSNSLYSLRAPVAGSQKRIALTQGVLRLTLRETGYDWAFLDTAGRALDSGRQRLEF